MGTLERQLKDGGLNEVERTIVIRAYSGIPITIDDLFYLVDLCEWMTDEHDFLTKNCGWSDEIVIKVFTILDEAKDEFS